MAPAAQEPLLRGPQARELFRLRSRTASNYANLETAEVSDPIPPGVWVVVGAQFVFYGVTTMMLPALFKHCQSQGWEHAPTVFSHALLAAAICTFLASFAVAAAADRFGDKRAYQIVVAIACCSAIMVPCASSPSVFIAAWALLKAVSEGLRGVKNAYMGKHAASRYNYASNFALNSGLVSSVAFPALGALFINYFGESEGLMICGFLGAGMHVCLLLSVCYLMPTDSGVGKCELENSQLALKHVCVECGEELSVDEDKTSSKLCKKHMDNYSDCYKLKPAEEARGMSFNTFKVTVICLMCITTFFFQFAVNITVMALFQPLMVQNFKWGSPEFSALQSLMSLLGMAITTCFTILAKHKTITAKGQCRVGGLCFCLGIGLFVIPPVSEYRLVAAQIFGFLSQIIFSGPWNVVFGQIMTKDHLTSTQMSILGSMIAVGQSAGCAAAPHLLPFAGSMVFTIAILPVICGIILLFWVTTEFDPVGRAKVSQERAARAAYPL